ncbi:hypothetical protein F5Y11DRAFT_345703 [Daldinia sp. FL1419]|nr:hypothetical protein F5Y11DRAFT_345703 [Daldinia sp. FL1419]
MGQHQSTPMGQATHRDAAARYKYCAASGIETGIEGAWVMRKSWQPKPPFDRLLIGGSNDVPSRSKQELKAFAGTIETKAPGNQQQRTDDSSIIKFIARNHIDAIRYAVQISATQSSPAPPRLVMFTDGSLKGNAASYGITYKRTYNHGDGWIDAAYGSKGMAAFVGFEAVALHRGLWIAYYDVMHWIGRCPSPVDGGRIAPPTVIVITDGLSAIQRLHYSYCCTKMEARPQDDSQTYDDLVLPLDKLVGLGCKVEIHWVPGHVGIEGNTRADSLASKGADHALKYIQSTGTDLILPFSKTVQGQKTRGACPYFRGSPMNDYIHWHKAETREAIKSRAEQRNPDHASSLVKARGIRSIKIPTKKQREKQKQAETKTVAKRTEKPKTKKKVAGAKALRLTKWAEGFIGKMFPNRNTNNNDASQSKRKAEGTNSDNDPDYPSPRAKRQKTDHEADDDYILL